MSFRATPYFETGSEKYAWINNQQDWPDVYGLPRTDLFGVFGTTWYQGLDLPGVKEFNAKYQKANPDSKIKTPGNVFYNGNPNQICTGPQSLNAWFNTSGFVTASSLQPAAFQAAL